MKSVRIWFQKVGAAKYVSHLDLARCMSRVLKISRLPVWYTEGYNPRIYMTFAMPLSLGVSGLRECMDIRLTEEVAPQEIKTRLNARLPNELKVLDVTEPKMKFEEIAHADYELRLETENPQELEERLRSMLSGSTLLVTKHSKKGEREIDIKPYFTQMEMRQGDGQLLLSVRLPSSVNGSINPNLFLDAAKRYLDRELFAGVTRKRLLNEDFCEFL